MKPSSRSTSYLARMPQEEHAFAMILFLAAMLFTWSAMAMAPSETPLVTPQWLQQNRDKETIRIIDLQPIEGYRRAHIEGSVNSQYSDWRHRKPLEGKALPDIAYLTRLLGGMGISAQTHVVLAPLGLNASEIAIATRIYWTFKILGHEKISILDGGLIAYSQLPNAHFSNEKVKIEPVDYVANPDLTIAPSVREVMAELNKDTLFIDYRSQPEYLGLVGGTRRGTIPGSKNLPFDLLVQPGQGGRFLQKEKVLALYKSQGIDPTVPAIGFCNSGHRASLAWFVQSEILGNKDARLYDGSMAEWAQYPDNPVAIPKP